MAAWLAQPSAHAPTTATLGKTPPARADEREYPIPTLNECNTRWIAPAALLVVLSS